MTDTFNWQPLVDKFKIDPPTKRGRRIPYVLFGVMRNDKRAGTEQEGRSVKTPDVWYLDMSGDHATQEKIDYYHRKGHVILDYWLPDVKPIKELGYTERESPLSSLAAHCEFLKNATPGRAAVLEDEVTVLRKKISEYEKREAKK